VREATDGKNSSPAGGACHNKIAYKKEGADAGCNSNRDNPHTLSQEEYTNNTADKDPSQNPCNSDEE